MHRRIATALRRGTAPPASRGLRLAAVAQDDTLLPLDVAALDETTGGYTLRHELDDLGVDLYIGVANAEALEKGKPGNGGMRLMAYDSPKEAAEEALALAKGMDIKHSVFNTGFAGIKLVAHARHGVAEVDKAKLIRETASLLNTLQGTVYTGCDLNTTPGDMDDLQAKTPYVLAGIPNTSVNPNNATAMGVVGGIEGLLDSVAGKKIENTVFFVHGAGSTGSVVARSLADKGCKVYACDSVPGRAAQPGVVDLSDKVSAAGSDWATCVPDDVTFLVPCSCSNLLHSGSVNQLPQVEFILGATNLPFTDKTAQRAFKGTFVPEGISSAGAVIADSVEHANVDAFTTANPQDVYNFTRAAVYNKVTEAVAYSRKNDVPTDSPSMIAALSDQSSVLDYVGSSFETFAENTGQHVAPPTEDTSSHAAGERLLDLLRTHRGTANGALGNGALGQRQVAQNSMSGSRAFSTGGPTADVAIVGGGIMGLSIAYQLKRRAPEMKVVVLESAPGLGYGSSGYSTGFLRAFYSFDHTMGLALDGISAYKNWGDYTRLGAKAEAYFTETHALWMLGKTKAEHDAMKERLQTFGVSSEVFDASDVKARFPAMDVAPFPEYTADGEVADRDWGPLSALFEHGCGHMDSSACLRDMLAACQNVGVDVRFKAHVSEVVAGPGGALAGLKMKSGDSVTAGHYINCAGPWFAKLNSQIGVTNSTNITPMRIQVGHKQLPDDEQFLGLPFVADYYGDSGIYFMPRRANRQLVFGSIAHKWEAEEVDPDDFNAALDPDFKQDYLNCLFHRLPSLPTSGEIVGFSHMYTVNHDDVHPVIGPAKEYSNLSLCNGFSGHGFKLAPAVGSLVAQQITGAPTLATFETNVPKDFLDPNREALALKVKTHFA